MKYSIKKIIKTPRALLKLLFGFCPECNSDAPSYHNCKICGGKLYPLRKDMWNKWKDS